MCGIVGYVGPRDARDVVLEGLRRLEYRGYDSAGIAVVADGELTSAKKAGKLANLEKVLADRPLPPATVGIGHTRWATHGGPTDRNAHPHLSADGTVAVIHNGIIENFAALRAECEAAGVEFASETDTEVAAHLLATTYEKTPEGPGRLAEALRTVSRRLEGAFTLVAWHAADAEKGGHKWFMLKEIAEQPRAIADTLLGRTDGQGKLVLDEVRLTDQDLRDIDKVFVVACGTAY